jgi:hypothetical protein
LHQSHDAGHTHNNLDMTIKRNSEEVKLQREFLAATLQQSSHITVGSLGGDSSDDMLVCQVLSLETRDVLESTFSDEGGNVSLFSVTVQPYQIWSGVHVWPHTKDVIAAFIDGTPRVVDILGIIAGADPRSVVFEWSLTESDVSDCICLCSPTTLTPVVPLSSPSVPVLCLLDAVRAKGFEGRACIVSHQVDGPLRFDSRKICSKRAYLQCLLALPDIFAAGVEAFPSDMPQVFYNLLLKSPEQATLGLTAAEYKLMLAGAEHGHHFDVLDAPVPILTIADIQRSHEVAGDEGMEALGDDMPLLSLLDGGDDLAPVGEAAGDAPLDVVAAPAVAEPVMIAGDEQEFEVPEFILGQRVRQETHYRNGVVASTGIRAQCMNPLHDHSRFRSLNMDTDIFGPRAAEFHLWVWLSESFSMDCERHAKYKPPRAEVRQIADTYG